MMKTKEIIYKDQILNLKSGDIILFRNDFILSDPMTWIAAAIRFFTKVKYNHAAVVVSCWGKLMLNEANEKGVICRPAEKRLERVKTSILIIRRKGYLKERDFGRLSMGALGTPYDFNSLFLSQLFYRVTGIWLGKSDASQMVCTEYAAWCHQLPEYWKYSAKELLNNKDFFTIYKEENI
jgi:hypothetical protein